MIYHQKSKWLLALNKNLSVILICGSISCRFHFKFYMDIKEIKTKGYERVVRGCHEKSNFNAFIAIHTLKNGPAFGGIRYFNYRNNERACLDVKKLAEAMTEKCMVAGIDLSGGKTAIQKTFYKNNKAFKVEQKNFYPCLGELINYLNGDYYGGLDVGFDYTMLQ